MGNLWGTHLEVPHPGTPVNKGIGGMWGLFLKIQLIQLREQLSQRWLSCTQYANTAVSYLYQLYKKLSKTTIFGDTLIRYARAHAVWFSKKRFHLPRGHQKSFI